LEQAPSPDSGRLRLRHMIPEHARGDLDLVGSQSAVSGLGVVLDEVLTGLTPFRGRGSTGLATPTPPTASLTRCRSAPSWPAFISLDLPPLHDGRANQRRGFASRSETPPNGDVPVPAGANHAVF